MIVNYFNMYMYLYSIQRCLHINTQSVATKLPKFSKIIYKYIIDVESFADLNSCSFNPIEVFVKILSHCLGQKCLLFSIIKKRRLHSLETFTVLLKTMKNVSVKSSESAHLWYITRYSLIEQSSKQGDCTITVQLIQLPNI